MIPFAQDIVCSIQEHNNILQTNYISRQPSCFRNSRLSLSISYSDFALAYSNSSIISCSGAFVNRLTMITNASDTKNAGSSS